MSKNLLRFGFHDFLNAQPLLLPLSRLARQAGIDMVLDTPSSIAAKLRAGELDLGMIPSVEYLRQADRYRLLPGLTIASRGTVGTVLLITKKPLAEVGALALDSRSLTSAALLRILFEDQFPPRIRFHNAAPDLDAMLKNHDAALIIGDQAFKVKDQAKGLTIYDLSEEWFRRTGKTFVHAVVAVRVDLKKETVDTIQRAKSQGLREIPEIAKTQAGKYGISADFCEDYLRNKIIYELGEQELAGLTHFRGLCHQHGIIDHDHPIRFVET